MRLIAFALCAAASFSLASGQIVKTTTHGAESETLDGLMSSTDLLQGLIATELPGDNGWHPANPAAGNSLDPNGLPAFTDGIGNFSGLTGLLNDFPTLGQPTKKVEYDLGGAYDLSQINIFTGNRGKDGRVFSTTVVRTSSDGVNFDLLGYFESDLPGTINQGTWGSTLVALTNDNPASAIASDVRYLQFDMYAVDNTGGEYRDPFDGVNPFNGIDDTKSAAFSSPLVYELDVYGTAVPEPSSVALCLLGLVGLAALAARRRVGC